ncbi:MAG: cytochrome c-type biogenesis heme exporter protein B [Candidatus Binatia bacterium]|nr:MAG: cytochrome c-type biogenesis heme exporter protein B [Candidatus Binatia bacterium]
MIWDLIKKDLRLEWRAREMLPAFLLMGLLSLVVFSFAFDPARPVRREAAPGAFWVAYLFTAVYGLGRAFVAEQQNDAWEGLLLSPVDRGIIFLSKACSTLIYLLLVSCILIGLFTLFFDVHWGGHSWSWLLATFLASVGLSSLGTLFSAISMRTRAREVMLPLLLLPLVVPLFLGGVKLTERAFAGKPPGDDLAWLHLMIGFDVATVVVAWVLFEYVVQD